MRAAYKVGDKVHHYKGHDGVVSGVGSVEFENRGPEQYVYHVELDGNDSVLAYESELEEILPEEYVVTVAAVFTSTVQAMSEFDARAALCAALSDAMTFDDEELAPDALAEVSMTWIDVPETVPA